MAARCDTCGRLVTDCVQGADYCERYAQARPCGETDPRPMRTDSQAQAAAAAAAAEAADIRCAGCGATLGNAYCTGAASCDCDECHDCGPVVARCDTCGRLVTDCVQGADACERYALAEARRIGALCPGGCGCIASGPLADCDCPGDDEANADECPTDADPATEALAEAVAWAAAGFVAYRADRLAFAARMARDPGAAVVAALLNVFAYEVAEAQAETDEAAKRAAAFRGAWADAVMALAEAHPADALCKRAAEHTGGLL